MRKHLILLILFGIFPYGLIYAQPSAPGSLKVSQNSFSNNIAAVLTWDSDKAVVYNVYRKDGAINDPGSFSILRRRIPLAKYLDNYVEIGHTYSYYVTAENLQGESSPSNKVELKIEGKPPLHGEGNITGIITDEASGSPINMAAVEVLSSDRYFRKILITGSSGSYAVKVPAGYYIVHFNALGYNSEFFNNESELKSADIITVKDNETVNVSAALKLRLPPPQFTLSGKVTDTAGNPLVASIIVLSENHRLGTRMVYTAVSGSNGEYAVKLREGDSVVVFAKAMDGKTAPIFYNNKTEFADADVILVTKDITGIDFVLPAVPGHNNSISGTVKNSANAGVRASITAFMLDAKKIAMYKRTVITDEAGNYTMENLTPGTYIFIAVPSPGYLPAYYRKDGKLTLRWKEADQVKIEAASRITGIDFNVESIPDSGFALIKGTVQDNLGGPVAGCFVYVLDENNSMITSSTSGADGSYVIENLSPGKYTVVAEKVSYEESSQPDVLLDYQSNLEKNVQLTVTPLEATGVDPDSPKLRHYTLLQNYPNPFNPATAIEFGIPQEGLVTLKVYNLIGEEIATLVNEVRKPGDYKVNFQAGNLPSGIYFYKLNLNGNIITRKMLLLR